MRDGTTGSLVHESFSDLIGWVMLNRVGLVLDKGRHPDYPTFYAERADGEPLSKSQIDKLLAAVKPLRVVGYTIPSPHEELARFKRLMEISGKPESSKG